MHLSECRKCTYLGGGTGRRAGLKIQFPATEVRVQLPSRVHNTKLAPVASFVVSEKKYRPLSDYVFSNLISVMIFNANNSIKYLVIYAIFDIEIENFNDVNSIK
jgi:hypothetical protein